MASEIKQGRPKTKMSTWCPSC